MEDEGILIVIGLIFRIGAMFYCVARAEKLHREPVRWGLFAMFMPLVAAIIISAMKPHIDWEKQRAEERTAEQAKASESA